jgi:sulfatase modifying factor 1
MKLGRDSGRIVTAFVSIILCVGLSLRVCSAADETSLLESPRGNSVPIEKLEGPIGDEWTDAARTILPAADGEMEVMIKHDQDYLYLAFDIDDSTKENNDEIQIYFDTLHNKGRNFNQPDDKQYVIWRSGRKFLDAIEAAVAERSGGWQLEGRVPLPSLNNPQPGSTLGFRIYHRDKARGLTFWPQGSYYPDSWGDLIFAKDAGPLPPQDQPPTISILVTPERVQVGETFRVLLKAEDDVGLQSMWWWGENTGIPELDKAHTVEVSGNSASSDWKVPATQEGTFTLLANARDSAYPTPGEAHQASEGMGIASATITVVVEEVPVVEEPPTPVVKEGDTMVLIPAGEFIMGSDQGRPDEKPAHTVYLDAYYIDKYEVTNAQFCEFLTDKAPHIELSKDYEKYTHPEYDVPIVIRPFTLVYRTEEGRIPLVNVETYYSRIEYNDGRYQPMAGYENHPAVAVSWYGARAYAQWAEKRLPTEAEWEKAARGGLAEKQYPWGNDKADSTKANYTDEYDEETQRTTPVGSYPQNDYGLYDMAGNVSEWCSDWYAKDYYAKSSARNPQGPDASKFRVARGGSWLRSSSAWIHLRCAFRNGYQPDWVTEYYLGFRCVRSASLKDHPPTVSIAVTPRKVKVGETFTVTVEAKDDVGLQSMWWWGENTGIPELDKAHIVEISGKSAASSWTAAVTQEGTFTLLANARDSAYPAPGEAHQASEGMGVASTTITVVSEETP